MGMGKGGGGGDTINEAPDYKGAAEEQAGASAESARNQTYANRPDQITPWGSSTWNSSTGVDPTSGEDVTQWTQNLNLSPQQQQALDAQMGIQAGRSGIAQGMLDRAGSAYDQPFDWGGLPELQGMDSTPGETRQAAEDAAYGRATSRLDPQFESREQQSEIALRNKGLRPGDAAYDSAMDQMGRDRTDAYGAAQQNATAAGRAESAQMYGQQLQSAQFGNTQRQQAIAEQMQQRGMPINEINAMLTGQQVAQPNMPGFQSAAGSQTPQYLNAANMQGQFDIGSANAANAQQAGMFGGIGSMMQGAGSMFNAFGG